MKQKRISRELASSKYGVITSGVNSMYSYYLREDGCVVDSDGDIRFTPRRLKKLTIQPKYAGGGVDILGYLGSGEKVIIVEAEKILLEAINERSFYLEKLGRERINRLIIKE